jgi:hypothetical protein
VLVVPSSCPSCRSCCCACRCEHVVEVNVEVTGHRKAAGAKNSAARLQRTRGELRRCTRRP